MNTKLIIDISVRLIFGAFFIWLSFNQDFVEAHLGSTGAFFLNLIPLVYITYIILDLFPTKTLNPRIKNKE